MKKLTFNQVEKIIKIVFFTFLTIALTCVLWNIIVNKAPIYL